MPAAWPYVEPEASTSKKSGVWAYTPRIAAPLAVQVTVSPNPTSPGTKTTIQATTTAGAQCQVSVVYPSGTRSTARALQETQTAGADGTVLWTWTPSSKKAGQGKATVACTLGSQSGTGIGELYDRGLTHGPAFPACFGARCAPFRRPYLLPILLREGKMSLHVNSGNVLGIFPIGMLPWADRTRPRPSRDVGLSPQRTVNVPWPTTMCVA